MKLKFLFFIVSIIYALSFNLYSQESLLTNINMESKSNVLNKNIPNNIQDVIIYALPDNGGTSGNARAPQGSQRYIRTVYLITEAELEASAFPENSIVNLIGFNYSVAQSVPTTGDFKVYLENTSDATYNKVSDLWADIISPMTLAHDDPVTIPAATGFWDIPFVNGSPFTYTGGGIYVAFEYQNPAGTISANNTALCNTNLVGGLRNAFSTTALPTSVSSTASSFRPGTRLGNSLDDVIEVALIYTLGKAALPSGNPISISTLVNNNGSADASFDVVLTVFKASDGTVRFTDTKSVANLASGGSQLVSFAGWTAGTIELDSIKVEVSAQSGETYLLNNRKMSTIDLNEDTFSYAQGIAASGVGVGGNTIDMAAKYTVNTTVNIDQISVGFTTTGEPYTVSIWASDGPGGSPGTNLFTSASQSSSTSTADIAVSPTVAVSGDFYVSVAQTGTVNIGLLYQSESPLRSGTFFLRIPGGTGAWGDFAPNNAFRVVINTRVIDGPVPVELTSFAANVSDDEVMLNWSTATETNNKGFEVERKSVGGEYLLVGFINGKGTTTETQNYSYADSKLSVGSYTYRLKQIDYDGTFEYSNEVEAEVIAPAVYSLNQNYPNPFNPSTKISFSLASDASVTLKIFDVLGQEVAQLVNGVLKAGANEINFNASSINSGVYIYKIEAKGIDGSNFTSVKKMILTK